MIRQRAATRSDAPQWWETDTPVYRAGAVAQAWGVDPLTYLRWPAKVRRYCELFMVAKALKERAMHEQLREGQAKEAERARFEQQAQAWERESQARWNAMRH